MVHTMTRLDEFISRLTAQRDILNHVAARGDLPPTGPVLEIGLGNGRTYSHLSFLFAGRRIIAFDRAVGAHTTCLPEPEDTVLGDIRETTMTMAGCGAALVHVDIGTGYPERDAFIRGWLPACVEAVVATGGFVASGLELQHDRLIELPRLPTVEKGRYFLYRKE